MFVISGDIMLCRISFFFYFMFLAHLDIIVLLHGDSIIVTMIFNVI